jgi:putative membrane protein
MAHGPGGWPGPAAEAHLGSAAGVSPEAIVQSVRPEIVLPLALLLAAYIAGWWRLRRRAPPLAPIWRLLAYVSGAGAVCLALSSPIDRLAHQLFSVHMLQHLLLVKLAAPAFLLADPLTPLLWALPAPIRARTGRVLAAGRPLRIVWRALTWMPLTWVTYALTLWLWHLPAAYDAALAARMLHDAEHLAFFGAAILFWWPLIAAAPHLRGHVPHGRRIVYLVLAAFQEAALGLFLTLSPGVLYASYGLAAGRPDLGALEDQAWGGLLMWGAGGTVDMIAVLVLLFHLLGRTEPASVPVGATPQTGEEMGTGRG